MTERHHDQQNGHLELSQRLPTGETEESVAPTFAPTGGARAGAIGAISGPAGASEAGRARNGRFSAVLVITDGREGGVSGKKLS